MARRRRAVITAPGYAVQESQQGFATSHSDTGHQVEWVRPLVPCLKSQDEPATAMELEAAQGLSSQTPLINWDRQPQQFQSDMQVHLDRQPVNITWVAICPSMLEHHARLFLSELTSQYQEQGCGSHLPLPACMYIKRMGGIAPVPMDSASAQLLITSDMGSAPRAGQDTAAAAASFKGTSIVGNAGAAKDQGQALIHPALGVITNHAGPIDKQASTVMLEGMQVHRWSINYRSTLAGLRQSLESQLAMARPCTSGPTVTVVYLISPSDDPGIAYSCLAEGALQLNCFNASKAFTNPGQTLQPSTKQPHMSAPPPSTTGDRQRTPTTVGQATPPAASPQPDTAVDDQQQQQQQGHQVVLQVLLPSLLHNPCSQTACHAALAVFHQVLDSIKIIESSTK